MKFGSTCGMRVRQEDGDETPTMEHFVEEKAEAEDALPEGEFLGSEVCPRPYQVRNVWEELALVRGDLEDSESELVRLRDAVNGHRRSEGRLAKLVEKLQKELAERTDKLIKVSEELEGFRLQRQSATVEKLERELTSKDARIERLQLELQHQARVVQLSERLQSDIQESWQQVDKLQTELQRQRQLEPLARPLGGAKEPIPSGQMVSASQVAALESAALALGAAVRAREVRLSELEGLANLQAARIVDLEARSGAIELQCHSGLTKSLSESGTNVRLSELERLAAAQARRIAELEAAQTGRPSVPRVTSVDDLDATLSADSIACQRSVISRLATETAVGTPVQENRLTCLEEHGMGHGNAGTNNHTSCVGGESGERGPPVPRIEPATVVHYIASPGPQHRVVATAAAPSPESVQAITAAVAGMIRGQGLIGAANAVDMPSMTIPTTCLAAIRMHSQQPTSKPPAVPRCPSPPTLRVPSRSPPSSSRPDTRVADTAFARLQLSPFRERRATPTIHPPPSIRSTLPNMNTSQMAKQVCSPPTSFRTRRSIGTPSGSASFVATPGVATVCSTCGTASVPAAVALPVAEACSSTSSGGSAASVCCNPWAHGGGGQVRCQAAATQSPPQCHRQRSVSPTRGGVQSVQPPVPLAAAAAAATARATAASSVLPHRQSPRPLSCRSVIKC